MALSATLRLIKRKQIHAAPGKIYCGWTAGEAMWNRRQCFWFWVMAALGAWMTHSLCGRWKLLISCQFLSLFLPPWSLLSPTIWNSLIMEISKWSAQAHWDGIVQWTMWQGSNWGTICPFVVQPLSFSSISKLQHTGQPGYISFRKRGWDSWPFQLKFWNISIITKKGGGLEIKKSHTQMLSVWPAIVLPDHRMKVYIYQLCFSLH